MNRRDTLLGLLAFGAAPGAARAQPAGKPPRIILLILGSRPPVPPPGLNLYLDAFKSIGLKIPQSILFRADRVIE